MATAPVKTGLLNTWKEIASYLGRGVRTAQRWERHGLPVRRVAPGPRASVIADSRDIDAWLQSAKSRNAIPAAPSVLDFGEGSIGHELELYRELSEEMNSLVLASRFSLNDLMMNVRLLRRNCGKLAQTGAEMKRCARIPSRVPGSSQPAAIFLRHARRRDIAASAEPRASAR
jgi:hypothetical protein